MSYNNKNFNGGKKKDALADYVEVNVRIEKFYEKYPEGRLITDLVSWENGVVVMKAFAYINHETQVPVSTGHAYEKEGDGFVNKTSALENCETSAIGRALANAGFEIKKSVASKEEVANAKLNQPASDKKIKFAKDLINRYTNNDAKKKEEFMEVLKKNMKFDSIDTLTSTQATQIIDGLKQKLGMK